MAIEGGKKVLTFDEGHDNRKPCYVVNEKVLRINVNQGTPTVEIQLDYPGEEALVFIPLPGIFRPVGVGGSDQLFELNAQNGWTLKVRDKGEILARYPLSEPIEFPYTVYDRDRRTFAVGNSPPDMVIGP